MRGRPAGRQTPGARHLEHRDAAAILLVLIFVALVVDVDVVGHQAAADQQRQHNTEPFQGAAVPRRLAGNSRNGRLDDGESRTRAQAEFDVPGNQVDMPLAANLAPKHKNGDQRNQELRRISETKNGHRLEPKLHLKLSWYQMSQSQPERSRSWLQFQNAFVLA